jgi:hypothetical protein
MMHYISGKGYGAIDGHHLTCNLFFMPLWIVTDSWLSISLRACPGSRLLPPKLTQILLLSLSLSLAVCFFVVTRDAAPCRPARSLRCTGERLSQSATMCAKDLLQQKASSATACVIRRRIVNYDSRGGKFCSLGAGHRQMCLPWTVERPLC